MPTAVRVEGLSQLVRDLEAMGADVEDLKDAMGDIAREGADVVRGFVPHLSGALAGDVRPNRAKSKAVVTVGRSRLPYAGVINFGNRAHNIAPSYYAQRGSDVMAPRAVRRLEQELNDQAQRRGLR